jgi:hypothetical protein
LNAARRLFLLYPATRLIGWLLHWGFFTLLIVTVAGVIRGLLHVNYLPDAVLIPFLVTTAALAALVRLTVFFLERQRNFQSPLNRETSTALIWLIAVVFSFHISGLAQQDSRAKSQNRQFTTPTIREQS